MARRVSRSAKRFEQMQEARQVCVPATCDVCVVGGGASGLVAAITAAEHGAHTVILERDVACGRTILATGNGRCNFANEHLDPNEYNDPAFVESACGTTWLEDILTFFSSCGLAWACEAQGRMYPLSRQASSVRNVLLHRARKAGVILATARETTTLGEGDDGLLVTYEEKWDQGDTQAIRASSVVVSVGGATSTICDNLELRRHTSIPLLCPLACHDRLLRDLDGRRVRADVLLERHGQVVAQESGEILFRDYGLSGIAVFNLSRHAQPGDTLVVDLMPTLTLDAARALASSTLDGVLDPLVAQAFLRRFATPSAALARAKGLKLIVEGTTETNHAQVRRGGLATHQFDPTTLEAHRARHLHACGEALDVDGPCGGFNLAWAWKSGMVAGTFAAKGARR